MEPILTGWFALCFSVLFMVTSTTNTTSSRGHAGYVSNRAQPLVRGADSVKHGNPICHQLSETGAIDINIRGTFILRQSLILISNDWLVYDIPNANFEQSFGQMSLHNITALPIELKWNAFRESKHFLQIKDRIVNIYSVDRRKPILYFDVQNEEGLLFDLNEGRLKPGLKYSSRTSPQLHLPESTITSNGDSMFLFRTQDSHLTLTQWQISFLFNGYVQSASATATYILYYTVGNRSEHAAPLPPDRITLTRQQITASNDPYSNGSSVFKLEPIADWDISPGFIHQDYFHIFDKNCVYIFSNASFSDSRRLFYLDTQLYRFPARSYFQCAEPSSKQARSEVMTYPSVTTLSQSDLDFYTVNQNVSITVQFGYIFQDQNFTYQSLDQSGHTILIVVGSMAIVAILILLSIACYLWSVPSSASTTKLVPKRSSRCSAINTNTNKQCRE